MPLAQVAAQGKQRFQLFLALDALGQHAHLEQPPKIEDGLQDRRLLFTHEANHMEIAGLFFEPNWWQSRGLEKIPPGLVGGGSGIGLYISDKGFFRSTLGFAIKNLQVTDLAA